MRLFFSFLLTLFFGSQTNLAQSIDTDKILEEGKHLYHLEKASWHATDILLEKYPQKTTQIGGFVSYKQDNNYVSTVFFHAQNKDSILIRFNFGLIPTDIPISIDTLNSKVTKMERSLIELKLDAQEKIYSRRDTLYTFYNNTSFNLIPRITKNKRTVYVLTGPKVFNLVLIGNDYELNYNDKNEYLNTTKIHNSLLQYPYKSDDPNDSLKTTFHSHVNSDVISVTDICTLLLYKDFIEWTTHYVMSETYVTIFNLELEELTILTKEAWDKINAHQKSKNGN